MIRLLNGAIIIASTAAFNTHVCNNRSVQLAPKHFLNSNLFNGGALSRRCRIDERLFQPFSLGVTTFDEIETEQNLHILRELAKKTEGHRIDSTEDGEKEDYWKYRLILAFVALLWGTNFGTVKFIQNADIPASVAAASRFGIAGLAMSPFLLNASKSVIMAGLECGAWIALGYITQSIGLESTDANKSAFICSLTVVIVPLINWLKGRGIQLNNGIAALLALLGTGILELGDSAVPSTGDLWSLGQAVGFGIAFTRVEHYSEKFPGQSIQLAASQLFAVAAISFCWVLFESKGTLPDFSFLAEPGILLALGYTGLVTTALAVYLETIALQRVSAAEMSVIFSTEPLWATGFASILLGETLGKQAAIGAFFILAACLTAESPKIAELMKEKFTH